MNEWQWWDWSFALKLAWHGAIIGGALAIVFGAFVFRWAWRRGAEVDRIRKEVTASAEAKLAEQRKERIG